MRLSDDFYSQDVLQVAPALVGKVLCRALDSQILRGRITEVEAYRGEEDTACHARAGRTKRTETLYLPGGHAYVYLCYGIHHLLNVVTGPTDHPQAALIRGLATIPGPGRLTKAFRITLDHNRADLCASTQLWIEDDGYLPARLDASPRIGIGYATQDDQERPWRFTDPTGADPSSGA